MNLFENIWPCWFLYSESDPMFYTSLLFWIFFTAFLGIYSLFFSKMKLRNSYLLIISIFFYYKINGFFFLLLLFSSAINYFFGIAIGYGHRRKLTLTLAIVLNLLMLGFYKYAIFLTDTINDLFCTHFQAINWITALKNAITGNNENIHNILLPVGISFYTFQAISYLVDVYRKQVKPVLNFLDFSFYLSFFPQLVAGPIVRASYFIPQLYTKYKLTKKEFSHSLFLILKGLIKKMVIADFLAINLIDRVFDAPLSHSGLENLFALYSYAIQIYFDFSGYTDIAIGLALMFGFKMPVNFNAPYQATSLTDFWRRWHISLSLWLKDYLYIPLGGNRKGKIRTYINLFITMVLGGLWHGANIRFVIWGAIHGIALSFEKLIEKLRPGKKRITNFQHIIKVLLTFHLVTFAWIFFRLEDMEKIRQFFYQLKHHFLTQNTWSDWTVYRNVFIVFILGIMMIGLPFKMKEKIRGTFIASPLHIQIVFSIILLVIISLVAQSSLQPFIYFRF